MLGFETPAVTSACNSPPPFGRTGAGDFVRGGSGGQIFRQKEATMTSKTTPTQTTRPQGRCPRTPGGLSRGQFAKAFAALAVSINSARTE